VAVRFSTIFYGDYQKDGLSNVIFQAVKFGQVRLIDQGIAKRDFIPIEIAAEYLFNICNSGAKDKIINICSGESKSFAEVVELLKMELPDLKVENSTTGNRSDVLHSFSTEGMDQFGKPDVDLKKYINKYLKRLQIQ
jgi:dTDP-D-glucose 4,6-dehydratase